MSILSLRFASRERAFVFHSSAMLVVRFGPRAEFFWQKFIFTKKIVKNSNFAWISTRKLQQVEVLIHRGRIRLSRL